MAAAPSEAPWADRVLAGLGSLLELVAAEPDRARIVIVEAPTAGAGGREARYAETVAELTAILREGRAVELGRRGARPRPSRTPRSPGWPGSSSSASPSAGRSPPSICCPSSPASSSSLISALARDPETRS